MGSSACHGTWAVASGQSFVEAVAHGGLAHYYEREAEDFARGLLLDMDEAVEELLVAPVEVAEQFGVPEEMVTFQQPLRMQ